MEQQIQTKIIKRLRADGWLVLKVIKLSASGYPDLLCHRNGQTMYVEVKQNKGVVSTLQNLRIQELTEKGIIVKIWTDYETDFKGRSIKN